MKYALAAILLPGLLGAAILPDKVGAYEKGAVSQPALADRPVWDECGLKNWESAVYTAGKAKFTATVYQLQDSTAGLAAYQWQRPAAAKPSAAAKQAVETKDSLTVLFWNYLLSFQGYKPTKAELDALTGSLNNVDTTSLPVLATYLPASGLVPNSERYLLGPAALGRFAPQIPPSVAAFRLSAEAQMGVFHNDKGDMPLVIFSYPTHQIAMERIREFEKLPGVMAKRSGPLVAVTLYPPDRDFAERVLGEVRYQAEVVRHEYTPTRRDNIGELILNVFVLIGILLAFSVFSGLALGGVRALMRRGRAGEEADAMITLQLRNR
jgi:hypothetical protein